MLALQNVQVISSYIWRNIRLGGNNPGVRAGGNKLDCYQNLLVLVPTQPGLLDAYG